MTSDLAAAIVVGVDGSPPSLHALDWATREAVARHRPLRIVHAFQWPLINELMGPPAVGPPDAGLQHAAEQILSAAADRARAAAPTLQVSTDLPADVPAAALIDASHDVDLVVVGHRGLGGFTGLLLGSVGVQTAAHAACPVIVLRDSDAGHSPGTSDPARGQVVVGVDDSDLSSLAVDFAFAHAALHGTGVVAVHAHRTAVAAPDGPEGRARMLTDALAGYRDKYPNVPVLERLVHGRPGAVLIAESAGATLTVVGSRGRGGFGGLLLGSTSQDVLHHASSPVAIVRARQSHRRAATRARRNAPPAGDLTAVTAPAAEPAETGPDATGPPPSFGKALFTGRLPATMVMPYPRLGPDEQGRVDTLMADARDFLGTTYDPDKVEKQRWIGDDIVRGLGDRSLLGLYVAPAYGGQGLSQTGYCRVMEEFGGYDASLSVVMGVHQSIGMKPIHLFGSDDQKARFLPDLAAGRKLAGFALTEPGAKIAGSEFYWYAANRVFQLLGGQAYMADSPAAKALRDSRIFPIFEGSNDVLDRGGYTPRLP
ncbi:universal stress protein [Micromonospora saelicesensis]|uniref:universal stress protein n=1 Tax=Micromonospora saelicesensis TaxID=285676 RepID=UPI003D93A413